MSCELLSPGIKDAEEDLYELSMKRSGYSTEKAKTNAEEIRETKVKSY